jgi:hypothetical protein
VCDLRMDAETAKAIFTRMYQSLNMLAMIDQNKENHELSVAGLYGKFVTTSHEDADSHFFFNHQLIMGSLLAFIVLPQNVINTLPNTPISQLDSSWNLSTATISVHNAGGNICLHDFVRKIRNAIAHARYWVTTQEELPIRFEDRFNDATLVNFRAEIPINDFYAFCKRFNEWIITGK